MSAIAPNPQTETGIGGAHDYSQYYLPQNMGLDAAPPGAYEDSQYLTDEAGLRADISGQYQDELGFLGYTDEQGNYIPGSLLTDAQVNEQQYEQQRQQAILQNTQNAQQQGTLFSGKRAESQAQAEAPMLGAIAGIETKLPVDLSGHYEKAAGLLSSYQNQQSALLAAAAARQAAAIAANPPAGTTGGGDTTGGTTGGDTTGGTTTGGTTDTTTTDGTVPYRSGTQPFIAFASGGEVDGATPALIGEQGPEAVVPRTGLTPDENAQLTQLRQAAQLRMGGGDPPMVPIDVSRGFRAPVSLPLQRPVDRGFGTGPPVGFPPSGVRPPGWTPAHEMFLQGHHAAATNQWMANHPAAMAGRATIPNWARAAVQARLRAQIPVRQVLPPGYSPAGAVY